MIKKVKYLLLVFIATFTILSTSAQDKIVLKSGSNIEAKVLEINQNDVKYKKFENLEGPIYTIDKNDILRVVYENGQSDIFVDEISESDVSKTSKNETKSKLRKNRMEQSFGFAHYALYSLHEFEANGVTTAISYERILNDSGLLGLKVKGEMGYTEYEDTIVTLGVALNIYPFKNAKWLYVGPSIKYGALLYYDYEYDYTGYDYASVGYLGLGFNLGSQFQISPLFGLRAGLAYDFVQFDGSNLGDMGEFQAQVGFNFSF